MLRYLFFAAFIMLTAVSCTKDHLSFLDYAKGNKDADVTGDRRYVKSGVVLTFDDKNIDEWDKLQQVIAPEYKWKATFYVSHFSTLNSGRIGKLKNLQSNGHEIAGYGLKHLDAVKYIKENGAGSYVENEIAPMLKLMYQNRLKVVNFAYPYGSRNASTDSLLLKYFKSVRGTTYSSKTPEIKDLACFYGFDQNRLLFGLGIDDIYNNSLSYIQSVLRYAKENRKVVVLYAHKPVPLATPGEYQTSYSMIQEICKYVKENGMAFYTVNDLYRFR